MKKTIVIILFFLTGLLPRVFAQTFTKADTAIAEIYYIMEAKDYPMALSKIQEAKKLYPEKYTDLVAYEVNCYLLTSRAPMALKALEQAIVLYADSSHILKILYYDRGWAYTQVAMGAGPEFPKYYQLAIDDFQRVIAIDSTFDAAYLGIANYHLLLANHTLDEANQLPLDLTQAYQDMKNIALEEYKKAVPWLEKAYAINPDTYKKTLNDLYKKTEQFDKVKP